VSGDKGRVLAFELIISLAAGLLREAECRFGVDQRRISVLPVAVSEETGVAVFRHNLSRPSQSTIVDGHGRGGEAVQTVCGVVSLDSLFEALGPTFLSFIKIDAEGNEYRILRGAQKVLADMSPIIAMEFTLEQLPLLGRSTADFRKLCDDLGYIFYNIDGTPFSCSDATSAESRSICYEVFGAKRGHWGEALLSSMLPTLVERFLMHYADQKAISLPSLGRGLT
jgi:FkbM family methyltransferase